MEGEGEGMSRCTNVAHVHGPIDRCCSRVKPILLNIRGIPPFSAVWPLLLKIRNNAKLLVSLKTQSLENIITIIIIIMRLHYESGGYNPLGYVLCHVKGVSIGSFPLVSFQLVSVHYEKYYRIQ